MLLHVWRAMMKVHMLAKVLLVSLFVLLTSLPGKMMLFQGREFSIVIDLILSENEMDVTHFSVDKARKMEKEEKK